MRVSMLACVLALWGHQAHAAAQEQPVEPANEAGQVRDMAPIVATGVQPGPGMWKVHGPGGHVLWVLGTVSPLPGGLEWKSDDVEAVIARAGVVLVQVGQEEVEEGQGDAVGRQLCGDDRPGAAGGL